jgi:PRKCA-binding protein
MEDYEYEEDTCGMTVTSSTCTLIKDSKNLIGISIGGGAPLCPCLYIVQVFDNSPASKEASLAAGDEIVAVNRQLVKGKTKVEVAKLIQNANEQVLITYNKLHADPKQGKTLDLVLKKVKHRIVEKMSSETADALGLSRAILCNDSIVKKLSELEKNEEFYKGLIDHIKSLLKAIFELSDTHKQFGDLFAQIGARESQLKASESFTRFGDSHRQIYKYALVLMNTLKPMINDLNTYLTKAIPDTKLTIKKYADAKFEYLSYCLKVKEMDDEEHSYLAMDEPLYRVETGNYEYRLVLRCRQLARSKFSKMRQDVLVKMELLDSKNVNDIVTQLQRFAVAMSKYHSDCHESMKSILNFFPIEIDLPQALLERNKSQEENEEFVSDSTINVKKPYSDSIDDDNPLLDDF